jgi:hypothetical protein
MKKLLLSFCLTALIVACSDDSSSAESEKRYPLQLNENCENFKTDTSVWNAIENQNLSKLKKSLEDCASLDMELYDTSLVSNYSVLADLLFQKEPESDSILLYLLQNGMDYVGRDKWNIFATDAMFAEDTLMLRYALDNDFPISGTTVRAAITESATGFLGCKTGRYWYEQLIKQIPNVDSVRLNTTSDFSILHEFCDESVHFIGVSEEDQLFYFQDLIDRGYSINQKSSGLVELDYCKYKNEYQTDLQKKFTDILIKAGADTTLVKWTYSD